MKKTLFCLLIIVPLVTMAKRPSTLETVFAYMENVRTDNLTEAINLYRDGNRKEASEFFYAAYLQGKENNNVILETGALTVHATLLLYERKSEESEKYYLQILSKAESERDPFIHAVTHSSIAFLYRLQGNTRESMKHAQALLYWAENQQEDPFEVASAMRTLSYHYSDLRQLDSAYMYLMQAYQIHEQHNHPEGLLRSYHALSIYYNDIDSYEEAIRYDLLWLEKADELGQHNAQRVQVYNGLAISFIEIGNWDQAEIYAGKALKLAEELKLVAYKASAQATLAQVESYNGNYENAKALYSACIELYKEQNKKPSLVQAYKGMANVLLKEKRYREAENTIVEAIQLSDSIEVHEYKWHSRDLYGVLLMEQERWSDARRVLEEAYGLSEEYQGLGAQATISSRLAKVYDKLNRNQDALLYYRKTLILKDSLSEMNSRENARLMATRFRFNEQQEELEELDNQNEILEIKSETNTRRLYLLSGILILLSVLLGALFKLYRKTAKQEQVISTALADREILLKEIHHRVKNNLQVISSLLSMHSRQIDDPEAQQAMLEGRNRVKSMALIHQNLYSDDDLVNVNTSEYINKLIYSIIYSYKMREDDIALDIDVDPIQMDVDTMIPVGLIINELVSNAIKYAYPDGQGSMMVSLKDVNDSYVLTIQDSGPGFESFDLSLTSSLGYKIINAFVKKLKATLTLDNRGGAFVSLAIPK